MIRMLVIAALVLVTPAAAAEPQVVAQIRTGFFPCAALGGFGQLWVTNYGEATLVRVNPETNRVTKRIRIGRRRAGSPSALAACGSTVSGATASSA